jgi:hypothetical protein
MESTLQSHVADAKRWLLDELSASHSISDMVTVKIKKDHPLFRKGGCLACYRSASQFRSRPIIWVNADLHNICLRVSQEAINPVEEPVEQILRDTLAHEYGHVVAEYARFRIPELQKFIFSTYSDEEDFAEDMAKFLNRREPVYTDRNYFRKVLGIYRDNCFLAVA